MKDCYAFPSEGTKDWHALPSTPKATLLPTATFADFASGSLERGKQYRSDKSKSPSGLRVHGASGRTSDDSTPINGVLVAGTGAVIPALWPQFPGHSG